MIIFLLALSAFSEASPIGEYFETKQTAQQLVRAFDQELNIAVAQGRENFLAQSKSYPLLLAARAKLEALEKGEDLGAVSPAPILQSKFTPRIYPSPGEAGNMMGKDFSQNTFALTFDDGPSEKYTLPILEVLQAHRKKATFFWLAENVLAQPGIVKMVGEAQMPRENHSYSHAQLPRLSPEDLRREIIGSQAELTRAYGESPNFFRCPYGSGLNVARVRQMIADQDMIHVFWTIDSLDWQDKDPASIFARVKKQMTLEKRGIILFHDIHPQSVEATKLVLNYSDSLENSHGRLRWVTIPQAVEEINRRPLKDTANSFTIN